MRNCLAYATYSLPTFLISLGMWSVIEIFEKFNVITDVLTLDKGLRATTLATEMAFGATRNEYGVWTNRTCEFLLEHLVKIISNPGSPDEACRINTAIRTLTIKKHGDATEFYNVMTEGLHRRVMFQKMCQIAGPLADEVSTNSELLIMLINRDLMTMKHLQELSTFPDRNNKVANYLIHNVNNYYRLKVFLYVIQTWARDTNLIELVEEIAFDMEVCQCNKLNDRIAEDKVKKLCYIY